MKKQYIAPSFTSEEIIPGKGIMCNSGGCGCGSNWWWWWLSPIFNPKPGKPKNNKMSNDDWWKR